MAEAITSPPSGGYSPVYGGDQKGDQPNLLINTWNRLESDMVTKYSKLNNSKHGLWLDLKTVIWICIFFCCLLRGKINSQQIFSNTYSFSFKDAMLLTLSPGFSKWPKQNAWSKGRSSCQGVFMIALFPAWARSSPLVPRPTSIDCFCWSSYTSACATYKCNSALTSVVDPVSSSSRTTLDMSTMLI